MQIFSAPETLAVPVWLSTLGLISNGLRDFPRLLLSIYLWKYEPNESHIIVLLALFGSAFVLLHSILKRVLRLVWTQGSCCSFVGSLRSAWIVQVSCASHSQSGQRAVAASVRRC